MQSDIKKKTFYVLQSGYHSILKCALLPLSKISSSSVQNVKCLIIKRKWFNATVLERQKQVFKYQFLMEHMVT